MLTRSLAPFLRDETSAEVRRDVVLLTVARLAANACYRFAPPFLATISRGVGITLDQIGIAIAIAELAGLLSPLMARLVDALPRRSAMAVGLAGVAAGTLLAAASSGLALLAIALVVLGQSKVLFDLGLGSWIADHVPYERRSRIVGLTETSWALGLLVGVSLMGLVTAGLGWRAGYAAGAVSVVVMASLVLHRLPAEPATTTHVTRAPVAIGRLDRRGWLVVGGATTLMMSSQCLFVTFGSWLEDDFGMTAVTISAVVFGLGAVELGASLTSAQRTDRWGKETSAARGAALMVPAGIALALWSGHLAPGLLALVVAIGGFEFAIVSALAAGSALVPGSPARGLGILIAGGTLGRAIASVPATRLYERSGIVWPATLSAVLAACTVIAMLAARRTTSG